MTCVVAGLSYIILLVAFIFCYMTLTGDSFLIASYVISSVLTLMTILFAVFIYSGSESASEKYRRRYMEGDGKR